MRFLLFGYDDYEEGGGLTDLLGWADDLTAALRPLVKVKHRQAEAARFVVEIDAEGRMFVARTYAVNDDPRHGLDQHVDELGRPVWGRWTEARPASTTYKLKWQHIAVLDLESWMVGDVHLRQSEPYVEWEPFNPPTLPALPTHPE